MAYDLDQFVSDCRATLNRDPGPKGREQVRLTLERLLANKEFIEKYCGDQVPRGLKVLYEDPELGFQVLAHINDKARVSPPHDHGASWAIYGQATHYTDMIEWEREDDGADADQAKLKPVKKYRLLPGHAGIYQDGNIHSIDYPDYARFVRVTGTNLDKIQRVRFDLASGKVAPDDAAAGDVVADRPCRLVRQHRHDVMEAVILQYVLQPIGPHAVKAMLADGEELALVDLREELIFSQNHLLFARSVPLSRLELQIRRAWCRGVPRASCSATTAMAWPSAPPRSSRAPATPTSHALDGGVAAWARRRLRAVLRRQCAEQGVRRVRRARQRARRASPPTSSTG